MKKLNSKGFTAVEVLLLLTIAAVLAGIGWYVWSTNNKKADQTQNNSSVPSSTPHDSSAVPGKFESIELGLSLSYPVEWGSPTLSEGPLSRYQRGSYKQITFSAASNVSINFVTGPHASPLDACGYNDPVKDAEHFQNYKQAADIGWEEGFVKRYVHHQGQEKPSVIKISMAPSDSGPGLTKIGTYGNVLVYKDIDTPESRVKASDGDVCSPVTQEQADAANAFSKFYHFVANYSNDKVVGVNGQYDARADDDSKVRDQLITVLGSIN